MSEQEKEARLKELAERGSRMSSGSPPGSPSRGSLPANQAVGDGLRGMDVQSSRWAGCLTAFFVCLSLVWLQMSVPPPPQPTPEQAQEEEARPAADPIAREEEAELEPMPEQAQEEGRPMADLIGEERYQQLRKEVMEQFNLQKAKMAKKANKALDDMGHEIDKIYASLDARTITINDMRAGYEKLLRTQAERMETLSATIKGANDILERAKNLAVSAKEIAKKKKMTADVAELLDDTEMATARLLKVEAMDFRLTNAYVRKVRGGM